MNHYQRHHAHLPADTGVNEPNLINPLLGCSDSVSKSVVMTEEVSSVEFLSLPLLSLNSVNVDEILIVVEDLADTPTF